jgi:transposase
VLNLTSAALKVFLALDPCDMRKSFNGLHTLASDQLQTAPARDALFVFTNKRRNRNKLLYFDGTGFWIGGKETGKRPLQLARPKRTRPASHQTPRRSPATPRRRRRPPRSRLQALV